MVLAASQPHRQPVGSTWISANAGSGKTRALVERVVTLLLLGVTPERICCITYTKAAAGEMRERILGALRALLVMDDEACRARVRALTGHDDIALARSLFARVLDSPYGGLQLTTIHGFCQQLLRRFPLESGLSPHFTVLEDAEGETMQQRARQRLLELGEEGGELAAALALVAERSGEYGFGELARTAMRQSGWWQQVGAAHALPELLRAAIFAHHRLAPDTTGDALYRDAVATLITAPMQAPLRAALPHLTSANERKFAPALTRWLEGAPDSEKPGLLDALCECFVTDAGTPHKAAFTKNAPAQEWLHALRERCVAFVAARRALACAEESYAAALIARAYLAAYQQLKSEHQSLDYDDLIHHTEALLRAHGGWVMSKLDHRIDHLLVDEAQDTSPGQWRIVHTLVEELMVTGGGVGSGNVPRSLLVVGDEKQSIFSFQGADPKQFAGESARFEALLTGGGQGLARRVLEHSYRSAPSILSLVDAVAALPSVARALDASGTPARHVAMREDNPVGRVVLHPPVAAQKAAKPEPFTIPLHYAIAETAAERTAARMADEIRQWLDAGRCHPGDILILLWRRNPFASSLIRALEARDIPVAGIDRLKLSQHLAVRDLMALMQWCAYPGDDLALAQVLRSPIIGMDEHALEDLASGREGGLWKRLAASHPGIAQQLEQLRARRDAAPYAFLTETLEVQGARIRYAARFGEEVHEVLDELKAQAAAMPASLAPTTAAFADWITRSEREVKRQQEGAGHAVRIMTVHGAKGLEAPIVLMVNHTKNPETGRENSLCSTADCVPLIAFSDDGGKAPAYRAAKDAMRDQLFDEYYRLLYVALTRARDELHVFAAAPVPEDSWYRMVALGMDALGVPDTEGPRIWQDAGSLPTRGERPAVAASALPAWARRAPAPAPATARVLSPSRLVLPAPAPMAGGGAGANIRGVRIHRVLQFLTRHSDGEHIRQLLQLAAPEWDAATRDRALGEIAALHARERWLWEYPAHAEISVGGTVDGQLYSGQIDRLVLRPEAVVIVDYKTGSHIPPGAAEAPESYRLQMKIYKALLAPLYPHLPIRCALLWTAAPSLMWMDEAADATPWPILTKN